MSESPLRVWQEREGALLRIRLARPKANVLDAPMLQALDTALGGIDEMPALRAILVDSEGPHFSFGASVSEHLPESCAGMLRGFHAVLLRIVEAPVPVVFAVRGQCLGGAMELVLTGTRVIADTEASFGQPEIKLGVFAPAASALLPERIGRPNAEAMLLSGSSISADAAHAAGLVQAVVADPEATAITWIEKELLDKSAASLRHAMRAARLGFAETLRARLAELEILYLDELMRTHDANEGLRAFLERRPPKWEHR